MVRLENLDLEHAAHHEAGHAVMRRLVGGPATPLRLREDGSGECGGTGRAVDPLEHLRVTLAGPVAEIEYLGGLELVDLGTHAVRRPRGRAASPGVVPSRPGVWWDPADGGLPLGSCCSPCAA